LEGIERAYTIYNFKTIDQALFIMGVDSDTGIYNHQFIPLQLNEDYIYESNMMQQNGKVCIICGDLKKQHPPSLDAPLADVTMLDYSSNKFLTTNMDKGLLNQTTKIDALPPSFIENLEREFMGKINLCIICYSEELNEQNSIKLPCGHTFCKSCVLTHLTLLINEAKVSEMKCLQAGCIAVITDNIIKENLDNETYAKYIRFKKRFIVYVNLNNDMIPCVAPDCEEWISYREGNNPFVACEQGHRFCAKCKKDWHRKGNCNNVTPLTVE
jgi:hypothetical protein